jgi:formylmethanofuran dehydrogenase subunit E
MTEIIKKVNSGSATDNEQRLYKQMRQASIDKIMNAEFDELFTITEISKPPVRPARILNSLKCQICKEMTMESRIRIFEGKNLCIPCFMKKEQKI